MKKKKKGGGGGSGSGGGGGGDGDPKALRGDLTREESQEAERRARRAKNNPGTTSPPTAGTAQLRSTGGGGPRCVYTSRDGQLILPSPLPFPARDSSPSILRRGRRRRRWEQYSGDAGAKPVFRHGTDELFFSSLLPWRMNRRGFFFF